MNKNILGIIGGGQLGMFICQAAQRIGIKTLVYSKEKDFSAKKFCDNFIIGDLNDNHKIEKFIKNAEVFTIETENIPKEFLRTIQNKKKLFPSCEIIEIAQNRLKEKYFLNNKSNTKTASYFEVNNFNDLMISAKKLNFKCILKTQEFGYDGKGQYEINLENINTFKSINLKNFILEEKINFKSEVSVIVVSDTKQTIYYPPVHNLHKNSILRETTFPAKLNKSIQKIAVEKALKIASKLKLNGVLAVEMFITQKNEVLINEIAPRPHNSGHWSIDSCKFSQFDNLVSMIFRKKLYKPEPIRNCRMINIIGDEYLEIKQIKKHYKAYDYFKKQIRTSRKMGHYVVFE